MAQRISNHESVTSPLTSTKRKVLRMGRFLVMYDLSGIQSFIFSTNRVKEIVGASYLVSKALFVNVPSLLGEALDAWKTYQASDFTNLNESEAKTVYIGGGNALVLFGSAGAATNFTKKLKREVFLQTGGALRVCSARIQVDESTRLSSCLDPTAESSLRAMLDRSKAKAPHALPARGFSIDALDNDTQEPIIFFEKPIADQGEKLQYLSRSQRLKLDAYAAQHIGGAKQDVSSPLIELMGGSKYEVEFDKFFRESNAKNQGKRFLAIVHVDGNTMGQRIAAFLNNLAESEGTLEDDLVAMRNLSAFISSVYREALKHTIDEVLGPAKNQEHPLAFRPVVADGDDITFVCRSEDAFACVKAFVNALHEPIANTSEQEGLPKPEDLSVGAGIAFVKSSYPFSSAYAMAEELCRNAKKTALKRFGAHPGRPVSSVDFHVCSGELISNVADFRAQRLTLAGTAESPRVHLCIRPYYLVDDDAVVSEKNLLFDEFVAQITSLLKHSDAEGSAGSPWIARSKLKAMRDKYGQGVEQARRYGQLVCERDMALQRTSGNFDEGRAAFVASLEDPYTSLSSPEDGARSLYATFFDALDVLDLCEEIQIEEGVDA